MDLALRPAQAGDFAFTRRLYFETLRWIIERQFGWDQKRQDDSFARQFILEEIRIITLDDADIGWQQSADLGATVFLKQLFIAPAYQRRGIGTQLMGRLMADAARAGKAVTLGVVKINPAVRLYERLGFRTTHEDEHKSYMRWDPADRPTTLVADR
jgi:ribosomal protein S18 acetylase RimI-like enzyme